MCKVYEVILPAMQVVSMYPTWVKLGRPLIEKSLSTGNILPSPAHVTFHKTRNNGISNCAI